MGMCSISKLLFVGLFERVVVSVRLFLESFVLFCFIFTDPFLIEFSSLVHSYFYIGKVRKPTLALPWATYFILSFVRRVSYASDILAHCLHEIFIVVDISLLM